MNVLAYAVTANLRSQFLKAQLIQRQRFPNAIGDCKVQVVSDENWSAPSIGISGVQPENLWVGDEFWLARARNTSIWSSRATGVEWLVMLDADFVLTGPITQWPSTGFGSLKVRFQSPGENIAQSMRFFDDPNERGLTSIGVIMHRRIFLKHSFDESYVGYGSEDTGFSDYLKSKGIVHSPTDARAIHLWHAIRNHSRAGINAEKFRSIT